MNEPILVVMAAGMGSRYGGPKQIDPVGAHGEIIIDYSLYDAYRAGFRRAVFIIKDEIEADFKEIIGDRMSAIMETRYAYQMVDDLPEGFAVPEGRKKPWGTGHALLSCRGMLDAPFCVINADDFYGYDAFRLIYGFLRHARDGGKYDYAMVGYILENTLTENGHVARGVCTADDGLLVGVTERTHIEKRNDVPVYTEDDGASWHPLHADSVVSMNFWGFTPSFMSELEAEFPVFLKTAIAENPLKSEYFLPTVVNSLLKADKAAVAVYRSSSRWYGVTYREDKPVVEQAIREMIAEKEYPERLWKTLP